MSHLFIASKRPSPSPVRPVWLHVMRRKVWFVVSLEYLEIQRYYEIFASNYCSVLNYCSQVMLTNGTVVWFFYVSFQCCKCMKYEIISDDILVDSRSTVDYNTFKRAMWSFVSRYGHFGCGSHPKRLHRETNDSSCSFGGIICHVGKLQLIYDISAILNRNQTSLCQ